MTRHPRRTATLVVLGLLLLLVPDAGRSASPLALVRLENAKAVDFSDDVVWLLALGSDARPGTAVLQGNADAIELVGVDLETGDAVAIGIPRDSWVEVPGDGMGRINVGLKEGGPEVMAAMVEDLTGIAPTYVAVSGFEGFAAMVDDVGGLTVRSERGLRRPPSGHHRRAGPQRHGRGDRHRLRPRALRAGRLGLRPDGEPPEPPAGRARPAPERRGRRGLHRGRSHLGGRPPRHQPHAHRGLPARSGPHRGGAEPGDDLRRRRHAGRALRRQRRPRRPGAGEQLGADAADDATLEGGCRG